MEKELTLVLLAAGMGSRFGGLKQIEPIGPNGEFIIDYSIYDAIQAGFTKVVFIIKEENLEIFKNTIGNRVEKHIKVEYVFQKIEDVPEYVNYKDRTKPWGTAHAILAAKNAVSGNFVMINSDDYYGKEAFIKAYEFFNKIKDPKQYLMVSFKAINTMTDNGSVKRGVCEIKDNHLVNIIESKLEKNNNNIIASPLDGRSAFEIKNDQLVSMNFFGFTKEIFKTLENGLDKFFKENENNLSSCEYLIPDVIEEEIQNDKKVIVESTNDKWLGVTYREDKEFVVENIKELIQKGEYPNKLWK